MVVVDRSIGIRVVSGTEPGTRVGDCGNETR